jgi:hypothetical protein
MTQSSTTLTDLFDVTFVVGPERQPIRAHKLALAISSNVFEKMFLSNFPSEDEIMIDDIDQAVFEIMLNHIYHREFNAENIIDVLYAAEKYDLTALKKVCSNFVSSMTTTENAPEILGKYQHFNNTTINEKCLSIISDDPLNFFKSDTFVTLKSDVIRTIFKQPRLNCSVNDMKSALLNWLKHNQCTEADIFVDDLYDILEKNLQISKMDIITKKYTKNVLCHPHRCSDYEYIDHTSEKIEKNNVFIHGIGLLFGKKNNYIDKELVTITLEKNFNVLRKITQLVEKEEPKNCCTIQDVFFQKVMVKCDLNDIFYIKVRFESHNLRSCFKYRPSMDDDRDSISVISHLICTEINPTVL